MLANIAHSLEIIKVMVDDLEQAVLTTISCSTCLDSHQTQLQKFDLIAQSLNDLSCYLSGIEEEEMSGIHSNIDRSNHVLRLAWLRDIIHHGKTSDIAIFGTPKEISGDRLTLF